MGMDLTGTKKDIYSRITNLPRILKSPEWSFYLPILIEIAEVEIDHIIVPIRHAREAAVSRFQVGLQWFADNIESQQNVMRAAVGTAVEMSLLHDIPLTLLRFPDLTRDWDYCYGKMLEALPDLDRRMFGEVFDALNKEHLNAVA